MNQDNNQFNQNSTNAQDNNDMLNNQSLPNNNVNNTIMKYQTVQQNMNSDLHQTPISFIQEDNTSNPPQKESKFKKIILFSIIVGICVIAVITICLLVIPKIFQKNDNLNNNNSKVPEVLENDNKKDKRLLDFGNIFYDEINNIYLPYSYEIYEGLYVRKKDIAKTTWDYEIEQDSIEKLLNTNDFRKITDVFVYNDYLYIIVKQGDYYFNGTQETQYFIRKKITGGNLELLATFESICDSFVAANNYIIFAGKDNPEDKKIKYYSFDLNNYNINKIHDVNDKKINDIFGLEYILPLFIGDKVLFIYNNDYIYASSLDGKQIDSKAYETSTNTVLDSKKYQSVVQTVNKNDIEFRLEYIESGRRIYKKYKLDLQTGIISFLGKEDKK